jgi:transposase
MKEQQQRFVAFDMHQNYFMVGAVDAQQQIILQPRKVDIQALERWASKHRTPTDEVVIEASTNTWTAYDVLEPLVARVVVAHPYHIKLIASSFVKTDKRDTLALARLLAAHLIPEVWVPPAHVRELRALVSHRRRLMSQRTAAKNRLRAVLQRHQLMPPKGDLYGDQNRTWWLNLAVPSSEQLRIRHHLDSIETVSTQLVETERELTRLSADEQWVEQAALLIQLPGIAMLNAMTILGAIGDVTRFPSAKKLVGYAGLGGKVHASGKTHRGGGITKQGRTELRQTMVEAAWTAVTFSPVWKERYERLMVRIGKMKAITAIARKLLVVVWHVLTKQEADRQADPAAVERSLFRWSSQYRLATSLGSSRPAFVDQAMETLGLAQPVKPLDAPTKVKPG